MSKPSNLLAIVLALIFSFVPGPARAQDQSSSEASRSAAAPLERLTYALIIGNNKSLGRRRPDLHYADDDAARYFEILQTLAPGRVALLADFDRDTAGLFPEAKRQTSSPTRANLLATGRRVADEVRAARRAGHEVELYFVFAGHGDVEQGQGFVELRDARFRSSELEDFLHSIPFSRAHVILDSCNSFFMLGVRKPGGRHFATSEDAARALSARLQNVGVFLSTSAEGEAFEWSEIQSGIFSHVVRSGLLGGADANNDGAVSYLELAAFVDTATAGVRNPNMRPHVFARGPGAQNDVPISRLQSMTGVRRFALSDAGSLRVRLRDANGLPLLDAHSEASHGLRVALPEAWARGATLERTEGTPRPAEGTPPRKLYAVPEADAPVTLALLQEIAPRSAVRGPDETFQALFAAPFGPSALARYEAARGKAPPPVFGVSKEDAARMDLLLDQLAQSARGKRLMDGIGSIGFGALAAGAGIALLDVDENQSSDSQTKDKVFGGILLGLGGITVVGGSISLAIPSKTEEAAAEFRRIIDSGGDPAQAFAVADAHLQELVRKRRAERIGEAFFGALVFVGSATVLTWSEVTADEDYDKTASRLGWGAGMVAGSMIFTEAVLDRTPVDSLTKIWQDDPSLNQYQKPRSGVKLHPTVGVLRGGAFFGLTGSL
jgi:hypothetical protein